MRTSLTFWAKAALGAAGLIGVFVVSPVQAGQKVGVAAAVKPEATSQPPGGDASILNIGDSVV